MTIASEKTNGNSTTTPFGGIAGSHELYVRVRRTVI